MGPKKKVDPKEAKAAAKAKAEKRQKVRGAARRGAARRPRRVSRPPLARALGLRPGLRREEVG